MRTTTLGHTLASSLLLALVLFVSESNAAIIHGTTAGESLTGTSGADSIFGRSGDDTIDGGAGNDFLYGESGNDRIVGGSGNDQIQGGPGNDNINGGDGTNTIEGGSGADVLNGGTGTRNTLAYSLSPGGVTVNLATSACSKSDAQGDAISNFARLTGSNYADSLTGDTNDNAIAGLSGPDLILGGAGDDEITGDNGNDDIFGEDGDDTIEGGSGDDRINGGAGNDDLAGESGADRIDGGTGQDVASYRTSGAGVAVDLRKSGKQISNGHADGDVLANIEDVHGSEFNDRLRGDGSDNELRGFAGNDRLEGGGGNDDLRGGLGIDRFVVTFDAIITSDVSISDFDTATETLTLVKFAELGSTADVIPLLSTSGSDTVLTLTGASVTFSNVAQAALNSLNFVVSK